MIAEKISADACRFATRILSHEGEVTLRAGSQGTGGSEQEATRSSRRDSID